MLWESGSQFLRKKGIVIDVRDCPSTLVQLVRRMLTGKTRDLKLGIL